MLEINNNITKFPKPLDWFQKKLWRIKWIEWSVIMLILYFMIGSPGSAIKMTLIERITNNIMSFLTMVPIVGLIMTFVWKYFFIGPFKLAAMIPGFGFMAGTFVNILESVASFIAGFNYELILKKICAERDMKLEDEIINGKRKK